MRKVKVNINDTNYTLELNRDAVKWLEANGFSLDKMDEKFLTNCELLWTSLFIANHKDINPNLALKLQDAYRKTNGNKMAGKIIKFAIEEYNSFMNALAGINSEEKDEDLEIIGE